MVKNNSDVTKKISEIEERLIKLEMRNDDNSSSPSEAVSNALGELGNEMKQLVGGSDENTDSSSDDKEIHREEFFDWPDSSKTLANWGVSEYGKPDAQGQEQICWFDVDPWLSVVVNKRSLEHHFPYEHQANLEMAVAYSLPLDSYNDVMQFNGCVTVRRTAGLVSVMCGSEPLNIACLNIVDLLAKKKISVDEARKRFAMVFRNLKNGASDELTAKLQFKQKSVEETADMDANWEK